MRFKLEELLHASMQTLSNGGYGKSRRLSRPSAKRSRAIPMSLSDHKPRASEEVLHHGAVQDSCTNGAYFLFLPIFIHLNNLLELL